MSRFNASAMLVRLQKKGFIYEADLTWLSKRKSELQNYGRDRMPITMVAELDAIEAIERVVFLPCNGEAHSNAYIDNCMICMPRWGVILNKERVK